MSYTKAEKETLLNVARQAIVYGAEHHQLLPLDLKQYLESLRQKRATFVTLHNRGELRGCIGTLEAFQPLIKDVAMHAYAAAFEDPRFYPIDIIEVPVLDIHISVLSESSPMTFDSEADLIQQLRPGKDGLILKEGSYCGTFLPSVWEELPDPKNFLKHLKLKAGLPENYWSETLTVERYTTESIS
jgi:hypothetical protein